MTPAANLGLERKESLTAPAFSFDFFLVGSAIPRGGDVALSEGGFHTVIGRAASGGATAALERPFAFTSSLGGDSKVKTRGDDACSSSWSGEGGDAPISEPRPGAATPAPVLEQEKEETPPISEPWPELVCPFQRSVGFSFLHSGASEMSPPNELKSLPWWEQQQ